MSNSSVPSNPTPSTAPRLPYTSPSLERVGAWSAVTLAQSVIIGPVGPNGSFLPGLGLDGN